VSKPPYALLAVAALTTACAGTPQPQDDPAYVSPVQYDTYSCNQMRAEMQRVSKKIDELTKEKEGNSLMNTALNAYAISRGYSFDNNDSVELQRAHNKYNILDEMMIKKNCTN
jgi:hypothetical protein